MDDDEYDCLLELADQMEVEQEKVPNEASVLKKVVAFEQQRKLTSSANVPGVIDLCAIPSQPKLAVQTGYTEELSGLQVSRPKISSVVLQESYRGFCRVQLSKISLRAAAKTEGPWVTVAVVVQKTKALSSSGSVYMRWQISDLDQTSICVFMFGDAQRDLNKEVEGTVVALYNSEIRQEGGNASLTVKDATQVAVVGTTADFGICKGTKKSGGRCTMAVNRSKCDFCVYHAPAALRQLNKTSRKDINVAETSAGMKLQRQVTFASTTALAARTNGVLNRSRLYSNDEMRQIAQAALKDSGSSKGARLLLSVAQQVPKQGDRQLQSAGTSGKAASSAARTPPTGKRSREEFVELDEEDSKHAAKSIHQWRQSDARMRAIELLKQQGGLKATDPNDTRSIIKPQAQGPHLSFGPSLKAAADSLPPVNSSLAAASTMQLPPNQCSRPFTAQPAPGAATADAGMRAGSRQLGVADDSSGMTHALGVKNKAVVMLSKRMTGAPAYCGQKGSGKENATKSTGSQLPARSAAVASFAAAFGAFTQAVKPHECQSRYQKQVEDAENEKVFKFVESMEQKDQLAQKLEATTKVQTSAWQCEVCKRCTEIFPKECRSEGHSIKKVQAVKKWWTCVHCSAHFSCLGSMYPNKRCPKCQDPHKEFKPATAFRAPKEDSLAAQTSKLACKDHMLARGQEHGKFLRT